MKVFIFLLMLTLQDPQDSEMMKVSAIAHYDTLAKCEDAMYRMVDKYAGSEWRIDRISCTERKL